MSEIEFLHIYTSSDGGETIASVATTSPITAIFEEPMNVGDTFTYRNTPASAR